MSSGTPYIGSKISLISKAEIRYEGILYDVNSKEATVTLSKVKSYGTENRRVSKQIQPRDEVYEYIIFRGSDIKDLSVSQMGNKDEEPHQDPAILSAQTAPPPITRSDPPPRSTNSSSSILPTPPRPVQPAGYTQFPPGLGGYNPFGSMPYFGRPPPHSVMMGHHQTHSQINQSRQTPPTNLSTISSVIPQGNTTPSAKTMETTPTIPTTTEGNSRGAKPFTPTDSRMPVASKLNIAATTTEHPVSSTPQQQQLSPSQTTSGPEPTNDEKKSSSSSPTSSNGDKRKPKREGRKDAPKYTNYTPRGPYGANNHWGQENNKKGYRPPRGGQSGGGGGNYNPTPNRPPPQSNTGSQSLKYTKDFDFESANALFSKDQLEQEMKSKLRISDQDDVGEGGVSEGNAPVSPKEGEQEELEEGEIEKDDLERIGDAGYDKTKSFFDSISCESSTTNKRANRSQEMALNTETFGVSHNRGYNRSRNNQGRGYNSRYRGGRGRYNHYNGYNSSYRGGYYGGGRGGGRRNNNYNGGEQS